VSDPRGPLRIRDAAEDDLAAVHAINESEVPHVNSISVDRFRGFLDEAVYFKIAEIDTGLAGYLVAFDAPATYESLNFRWFQEHYADFIYVDRIAVDAAARRRGVASALYRDLFPFARARTRLLTCEVNTRPMNADSIAFHEGFGFREVGTQETDGGAKTVSLMAVELAPAD
jgi:predicted GNAT superfamily acetyltransferase